jgi:superfamily II DNA or RNA helicase
MNNNTYRGIVQWATGTGKTIGLLIILYQLAHKLKNEGKIFRGLLIAPTNDIFDTIMVHINKMNAYGIKVVEGHNAMLSTIDIPQDIHILVTATHASLTDPEIWDKFPSMNCIHYDEVHRITGSEFYDMLGNYMIKWGTSFLTGTSATPITCVKSQNTRISDLFNPYNIIHRCDMVEAINEGYIAKPCFSLHTINYRSNDDIRRIRDFISIVGQVIMKKRAENWSGGKCIVYLSTIAYVTLAIEICKELLPDFVIYSALENTREKNDMEFVNAEADGTPRLLLSCERYREGADIKGLELTSILIGLTISHNVLLQIMGRSLRKDTPNKEGWCVIVRPSGKRNEDVLLKYLITGTIKYIDRDNSYSNKNYDLKTILYYLFSKVEFNHKLCGSNYIKNIIKDVLINPQKYNPLE